MEGSSHAQSLHLPGETEDWGVKWRQTDRQRYDKTNRCNLIMYCEHANKDRWQRDLYCSGSRQQNATVGPYGLPTYYAVRGMNTMVQHVQNAEKYEMLCNCNIRRSRDSCIVGVAQFDYTRYLFQVAWDGNGHIWHEQSLYLWSTWNQWLLCKCCMRQNICMLWIPITFIQDNFIT
jgi:hypothetical protein